MKYRKYKYLLSFHLHFPFQPHYDVGILLTIVLAILTIVLIFAFRYKCKSNRTWVSESHNAGRSVRLSETRVSVDYVWMYCSAGDLIKVFLTLALCACRTLSISRPCGPLADWRPKPTTLRAALALSTTVPPGGQQAAPTRAPSVLSAWRSSRTGR